MADARRAGAVAGALAGLVVVLLGFLFRPLALLPDLPTLLTDRALDLTPGPVFGFLIDHLQYAGRPLLATVILLGEIGALALVGSCIAPLVVRRTAVSPVLHPSQHSRHQATSYNLLPMVIVTAVVLWLAFGLVVIPLAGGGLFGATTPWGTGTIAVGYLIEALAYATLCCSVTAWLLRRATERSEDGLMGADPMRRHLVIGTGIASVGFLGIRAFRRYQAEQAPQLADTNGRVRVPPLTPYVTPTAAFYIVAKNMQEITPSIEGWRLTVSGLVARERQWSYEELTALPSVDQYRTLACISNDVGGPLMSNALWRGLPLRTLLGDAGLDPAAAFVLFRSLDGYTESLPLAHALDASTLIAYQMNGAPLNAKHGYPARLLLAGRYGIKNPKWLTEMTVTRTDDPGFWEHHGWSEEGIVRTTARIDTPTSGITLPRQPLAIGGPAYAGDRGIRIVQISITPGLDWTEAAVEPAPAPATWLIWSYTWQPPAPGTYRIQARATDGAGSVQDAQPEPSFPKGAAGLHTITVHIR